MSVAFVISRIEEAVADRLFTPGETPGMDGALFKFRGAEARPAIEVLLDFANDEANDQDERQAALRLSERLGTWIGQNTPKAVADEDKTETPEQAPSPALETAPERRSRKAKHSELEAPVDGEASED